MNYVRYHDPTAEYAAMHHSAPSTSERYRQLRAMTIIVFPLAFSLLLPCGLDANEILPAIGIAPMFVSAVLGALAFRGISPGTKSLLDLFVATLLISVLVPSWLFIVHSNDWAGKIVLASYGTATMSLSFGIHVFLGGSAIGLVGLGLPTLVWRSSICTCCHDTLHSKHALAGRGSGIAELENERWHDRHIQDDQQPLINGPRGESIRSSSEYQTSGFTSPRRSAETLGTELTSHM